MSSNENVTLSKYASSGMAISNSSVVFRDIDPWPGKEDTSWHAAPIVRNCKEDHGERTNRKLRTQPYHQRDRKGKMKKW